jgi:hypothetical protein
MAAPFSSRVATTRQPRARLRNSTTESPSRVPSPRQGEPLSSSAYGADLQAMCEGFIQHREDSR